MSDNNRFDYQECVDNCYKKAREYKERQKTEERDKICYDVPKNGRNGYREQPPMDRDRKPLDDEYEELPQKDCPDTEEKPQQSRPNYLLLILLGILLFGIIGYIIYNYMKSKKKDNEKPNTSPKVDANNIEINNLRDQNEKLRNEIERLNREHIERLEEELRRQEEMRADRFTSSPPEITAVGVSPINISETQGPIIPKTTRDHFLKYNGATGEIHLCKRMVIIQNDGTTNIIPEECTYIMTVNKHLNREIKREDLEDYIKRAVASRIEKGITNNLNNDEVIILRGIVSR